MLQGEKRSPAYKSRDNLVKDDEIREAERKETASSHKSRSVGLVQTALQTLATG